MVQRLIISDGGHTKEFKTIFVWWLTIISRRTFSHIKPPRQCNNFPWALNELSFESWLLAHWMCYTFPRRKSGLLEKCALQVLCRVWKTLTIPSTHSPSCCTALSFLRDQDCCCFGYICKDEHSSGLLESQTFMVLMHQARAYSTALCACTLGWSARQTATQNYVCGQGHFPLYPS